MMCFLIFPGRCARFLPPYFVDRCENTILRCFVAFENVRMVSPRTPRLPQFWSRAEYTEYAVRILCFSNSLLVWPVLLCGSSREHHARKHFHNRTGFYCWTPYSVLWPSRIATVLRSIWKAQFIDVIYPMRLNPLFAIHPDARNKRQIN